MALPKVQIIRLANSLGRLGSDSGEGVGALCCGGVAVSGLAALATNYKLFSLKAAEDLGLTAAYDLANKILVHYHISEFFRLNPTGELHLRLVAQATTLTAMVDKDNAHLKSLLVAGEGRIRKAGVVRNPATGYTPTLEGGLDEDVLNAIPVAQELADDEYSHDRPINNICIEGRQFNGAVGDAEDLRDLAGGPYRDVTVCILQDPDVAALDALFAKTAAVGTYLGAATNKTASQSFAQPISQFNITDIAEERFIQEPYLSNGAKLSAFADADIDSLHDKGYVFGRTFGGYDGQYFNQSFNCAPATDDYNATELRDVINRAVRLIRPVMIPLINSTDFPILDGRIQTGAKRSVEADIRTALSAMDSDMSFPASDAQKTIVVVDPAKDDNGDDYDSFLSDPTLRVVLGIVPKGKAEQIVVSIGFTNG